MTEPMLNDFRAIIDVQVNDFVIASRSFGSRLLDTQADLVQRAFETEMLFIHQHLRSPEPQSEDQLRHFAAPVLAHIQQIQTYRQQNNTEIYNNHMAVVAESVLALNWISVRNTPLQFIRDMKEIGDYFGIRVLTAHRRNQEHVTWINRWTAVLTALEEYVRQHHRTGFSWNFLRRVGPGGDGPLPPVPPPLPPMSRDEAAGIQDARNIGHGVQADMQQVFNQINQGEGISRLLRPVIRGVARQAAAAPQQAVAQRPAAPLHPPVFRLDGRKWRAEYLKDELNLHVNPNDRSESLAMLKCERTSLETQAKMNAVTIDNCKRCVIVLQHVIAYVELIHCEHVEVRCLGSCPNITVDNCDCVQLFLSENSIDCEVITSKSTSTNICRLSDDGDYVECPVPEQIKSVLINGNLQSSIVQHHM